jgi:hypothetical protein
MVGTHSIRLYYHTKGITEFRYAYNNASGLVADFYELLRYKSSQTTPSLSSLLSVLLREAPEAFYLLRAAEHPASIPVSIASMRLVQATTSSFMTAFMGFLNESGSIAERFHKVRQLYEIENIPNNVVDGNITFPEDSQSLKSGMSVEFRFVLLWLPCHSTYSSPTGTFLSSTLVLKIWFYVTFPSKSRKANYALVYLCALILKFTDKI